MNNTIPLEKGPREICSPELSASDFEEMLAELDAICEQARQLSTQIQRQMHDQKRRERQVVTVGPFGGR